MMINDGKSLAVVLGPLPFNDCFFGIDFDIFLACFSGFDKICYFSLFRLCHSEVFVFFVSNLFDHPF